MTTRHRVRFRFRKQGDLIWIGHRDLMRAVERMLRRAELPVSMSEGYRPKLRLSFPSALAVGIRGTDEVLEVRLYEEVPAADALRRMQRVAPEGLEFTSCDIVPHEARKAAVDSVVFEFEVPADRRQAVSQRIDKIMSMDHVGVWREDRSAEIDVRSPLRDLAIADGRLRFKIRVSPRGTPRPREVLAALEIEDLEQKGCQLTRTAVELKS